MAALSPLALQMRRQREHWHELDDPPRRALLLRRAQAAEFATGSWRARGTAGLQEFVEAAVVDWRGFSEADLLGATVGAGDQMPPFAIDVLHEWIGDRVDVVNALGTRLAELEQQRQEAAGAAAKNSTTS